MEFRMQRNLSMGLRNKKEVGMWDWSLIRIETVVKVTELGQVI
jgi:hypothetical protein